MTTPVKCDFEVTPTADGRFSQRCRRCGVVRSSPTRVYIRACAPPTPGFATRAQAMLAAAIKWAKAGSPVRSAAEVAAIFDGACKPCPHFIRDGAGAGSCKLCGCLLRREAGLVNKLQMATESCPDTPPRWTAITVK